MCSSQPRRGSRATLPLGDGGDDFCQCDPPVIPPLRFSNASIAPSGQHASQDYHHLKLMHDSTMAERLHPDMEFSGALLWTNRPLLPNEPFRVQILRLSPKWSGSLTIGLTPIPPQSLPAPASILALQENLSDESTMPCEDARTGETPAERSANGGVSQSAVVSGVRSLLHETYLVTGASLLRGRNVVVSPFTSFNLEDLQAQDILSFEFDQRGALFLSRNGTLIADSSDGSLLISSNVPRFGILDMYGVVSKVRLLPSDLLPPPTASASAFFTPAQHSLALPSMPLKLHPTCGQGVVVTNGGNSSWKPNPESSYNQSLVLTNRPLAADELFEISVDAVCARWCGCLEIGVTLNSPDLYSNGGEEDTSVATDPHPRKKSPRGESNSSRRNSCRVPLPSTLTAMAKPTWLFTSKMIVVHGSIVNEDYSSSNSLDDLREGDTVGVVRKATGDLHFFINGKDLGVAAKNVPAGVYGVVDLYGKTAAISLVDRSLLSSTVFPPPGERVTPDPVRRRKLDSTVFVGDPGEKHRFFEEHGSHVWLSLDGRTARRKPGYTGGFLRGATFLVPGVVFEIQIDALDIRWPGSLCLGAASAGSIANMFNTEALLANGSRRNINNDGKELPEYKFSDVFTLHPLVGQRYGLMLLEDRILALSRNGTRIATLDVDPFKAQDLYPCFLLQGCVLGVSIAPPVSLSLSSPTTMKGLFSFDPVCDRNIRVSSCGRFATRIRGYGASLVAANRPLSRGLTLQLLITAETPGLAPAMTLGLLEKSLTELTSANDLSTSAFGGKRKASEEEEIVREVSSSILALRLGGSSLLVNGNTVYENIAATRKHSGPSLGALGKGHIIGLNHSARGKLRLLIDGADYPLETILPIPEQGWYPVIDLCGTFSEVRILDGPHPSVEEMQCFPLPSLVSPIVRGRAFSVDNITHEGH